MSLAALEILEQAQLPPAHARAIVRAIETDSASRLESLATKSDVASIRSDLALITGELRSDIASLRGELKGDITSVQSGLKRDIASVQSELKGDITSVKSELKGDIASVKSELRVEMRDMKSELLRWMFLAVMAQAAASGGFMYFLLNLVRG
jgi:hypothetical protein